MSRIRSPNYPQLSLKEAVTRAEQIHKAEGQNPASREVLAKLLGYGGLNGSSMAVLSAISKYGLVEEVGDKELKIGDFAMSILFPHSPEERVEALKIAANKPALFAEINEKWPDRPPGDENLTAYLMRRNFAHSAVQNVIRCYKETMELVAPPASEYDSGIAAPPNGANRSKEPPMMDARRAEAPKDPVADARMMNDFALADSSKNDMKVLFTDDKLQVNATIIDVRGLDKLIRKLSGMRALVERDEDESEQE